MYYSKKFWEYILFGTFERKMAFSVMFKPKSEGNRLFEALFLYISLAGGLFASLNSLHHYPCQGTPPTNSQPTKQFLSCLHGL